MKPIIVFISITVLLVITVAIAFVGCGEEESIAPKLNLEQLGDTHKLLATIDVGRRPMNVTPTPDANFVYVANAADDTVSVISVNSREVVSVIPVDSVGGDPFGMVASPDGKFIYVAFCDPHSNIAVISTASKGVVDSIDVDHGMIGHATITPDGEFIYVVSSWTIEALPGEVYIISTESKSIVDSISDIMLGYGIAITPDGKFVYVLDIGYDESDLVIISTSSREVVDSIPLEGGCDNLTITLDGDLLYITSPDGIVIVSIPSKSVVDTIAVAGSTDVTVSPDGRFVYVISGSYDDNGTLSIVSAESKRVVDTITVGTSPFRVAVTPDGRFIYVANFESNLTLSH